MISAVDTNILLDVLIPESDHAVEARRALASALQAGTLVISPVVYSEVAGYFELQSDLDQFVDSTGLELSDLHRGALFLAGQAWRSYNQRRRDKPRSHLITDFLIGAHAYSQADQLLTRDRGYYSTYFPALKLA